MKIPKILLKTMVIGLTLSTTTSCNLFEDVELNHDPEVQAEQTEEKCEENGHTYDCPACGMG